MSKPEQSMLQRLQTLEERFQLVVRAGDEQIARLDARILALNNALRAVLGVDVLDSTPGSTPGSTLGSTGELNASPWYPR